mgnify:CR=1 FL=1|jgi:hypothetical protein
MGKKRLFTFGCSHTSYDWPSWANILSLSFDDFYNFGLAGTGDFRILNQIQRANERFKFGKDDYIGIALSCNYRFDTIERSGTRWIGLGSMFDEKYHKVKFLRELNDFGGYERKLTIIKSIKQLLDNTETNYKMFNSFHLGLHHSPESNTIRGITKGNAQNRMEKIMDEIKTLCGANKTLFDYQYPWGRRGSYKIDGVTDGHYNIPIHLDLVKGEFGDWHDTKHDTVVMDWHKKMPKDSYSLQKMFHWLTYKQYEMIGNELRNPEYDGTETII